MLPVEVLAPVVAFGRRLAVVAATGAGPPVEAISQVLRASTEPGLVDHPLAQHIFPEQHAQAVMAQGVGLGRVGRPTAQRFKDLRTLALERLGELAQIVQRQPESKPRRHQVSRQPQAVGEQRSQRGHLAQDLDAHGRHVQAVIPQQVT
ncbi:MAG: hypothetical protein A3E25_03365 [Burkholderiales bacterium RIFCSPHIGHO2_12_FULL_69_20]|nr:MAG: hypothetical protein A3E25_03365 [Burkholderiales bacterium RIFCSPHIGHO2_12_FULL_69_20]